MLATSEEALPSVVPQGVKFLSLVEGLNPEEGDFTSTSVSLCRLRRILRDVFEYQQVTAH